MNIALGSIFRNSTPYLDRYYAQCASLAERLQAQGHSLRFVFAEADSTDGTAEQLAQLFQHRDCTLTDRANGSPWFGSVDHPERWKAISYVCNGVLEQVQPRDDVLIYVESDLIWQPETMLRLVEHVQAPGVDAVAAMCFHNGTDIFYDVWGHRKDGARFGPMAPYHPEVNGALTQIDSAGSCIVMRGLVARNARFTPPELGIVGFCGDLRGRGFRLWLDPTLKVEHP